MGNVLRVLGIVLASMVLGLVALFLGLFTICGGMRSSDGAGVLGVCLAIMAGTIVAIVFLGRGVAKSRKAVAAGVAPAPGGAPAFAPGMPPGLAPGIAPGLAPDSPYAVSASAAAPSASPRTLGRTDLQVLMGLRIGLVVHVLVALGSMAMTAASMSRYGSSVTIQLLLRSVLGLLPPLAVLAAVSVRTPPANGSLDAAAGLGIASLLFRFGMVGFTGFFTSAFSRGEGLTFMLLWMSIFSTIEAAIAGLAIHLRSRLGTISAGALIVAVLGFLLWDGLVQAAMQVVTALMF